MGDESRDDSPSFTVTCPFDEALGEQCSTLQIFGLEDPTSSFAIDLLPVETGGPGDPTTTTKTTTNAGLKIGTFTVSPTPTDENAPDGGAAEATTTTSGSNVAVIATSVPSLSNASSGRGSDGVSPGAVAGIAIATAIAGAAIAFLAAFLLFKRRNRNSHSAPSMTKYGESAPSLLALAKGGAPSPYIHQNMSSIPPSSAFAPPAAAAAVPTRKRSLDLSNLSTSSDFLAGVLPPAADDATIRSKIGALFNQIHRHVDNFYRNVHASITPSMETELAKFGLGSIGMIEQLQSSSQPTVAIKHALTAYILSITSADGEEDTTLFPREVVGLGERKGQFTGAQDLPAAYILYKRLSVHLHTSISSITQARHSDIREAAEHFALTFFPWANPGYGDHEKDEDLVQIISNALDLAIWLYGQPFVYEFVWDGAIHRGTVVAPALFRMTDEKGRSAGLGDRPHCLLDAVVVSR